jgi:hypothetical protein
MVAVKGKTGQGKKYGVRVRQETRPNQWTGSEQQEDFLRYYLDPKSPTFAHAKDSALQAGYSESYAKIIAQPSVNRLWVQEARDIIRLGPEHIVQALQGEALNKGNKAADRIRSLELIGKIQGIFVDKKVVAHINIEDAIRELK